VTSLARRKTIHAGETHRTFQRAHALRDHEHEHFSFPKKQREGEEVEEEKRIGRPRQLASHRSRLETAKALKRISSESRKSQRRKSCPKNRIAQDEKSDPPTESWHLAKKSSAGSRIEKRTSVTPRKELPSRRGKEKAEESKKGLVDLPKSGREGKKKVLKLHETRITAMGTQK